MKEAKKFIFDHLIPTLFLVGFCLFYVTKFFYKDLILYGEEQGFLDYSYVNYRFTSIWDATHNFGSTTYNFFNLFTAGLFWRFARVFFSSLQQIAMAYMFVIVFITTFFSFKLFNLLTKNRLLALLLSLVFITTYNYTTVNTTTPKFLHFAILPASLFFLHKYMESAKLRYIVLNVLFHILTLQIAINVPQMLGAYGFIFMYGIIFFSSRRNNAGSLLVFFIPYILNILFVFLVNVVVVKNVAHLVRYNPFALSWTSTTSYIQDILRLFGGWWDYLGSEGLTYNHLLRYYHSSSAILITYIPVAILFLLLLVRRESNLRIRVAILFILMLALVKGSALPFSYVFNQLFSFSIFKIFREPWAKFIQNFIFTVYIGIAYLMPQTSKKIKYFFVALLTLLLYFQLLPIYKGTIVDHRNLSWKRNDVKVPEYYSEVQKWSDEHLINSRVLVFPTRSDTNVSIVHTWKPLAFSGRPEEYFVHANIVSDQFLNLEDKFVTTRYLKNLNEKALALGSIDYVINKRDVKPENGLITVDSVKQALDIQNKKTFGAVDIYPVSEQYKTPKIRSADKLFRTDKGCDFHYLKTIDDVSNTAVLNVSKNATVAKLEKADLSFEKRSNTHYTITFNKPLVHDAGILFAELYNKGWQVYTSNSPFALSVIEEKNHASANCFANFWVIPKEIANQYVTLHIRYAPQLLFEQILVVFVSLLIIYLFAAMRLTRIIKTRSLFKIPTLVTNNAGAYVNHIKRSAFLNMVSHNVERLKLGFLVVPVYMIVSDILHWDTFSELTVLIVLLFWSITLWAFRFNPDINLGLAGIFLLLMAESRLFLHFFISEKMGIWFFVFFSFWVVMSIYRRLFPYKTITLQDLVNPILLTKLRIKVYFSDNRLKIEFLPSKKEFVHVVKKTIVSFTILVVAYGFSAKLEKFYLRKARSPYIKTIEPKIVYFATKVVITGNGFDWQQDGQDAELMTEYGKVATDFWGEDKIVFTVPLHWKPGEINLWIEKQTVLDGRIETINSKIEKLQLIPISDTFAPEDELYRKQLNDLSPETLQLNGYDPKKYGK